jgi:site-specific DNA-cytosine methylase
MPRALDLFSGMRTALKAFKDWDIEYVDIIDGIDIREYHPDGRYDFIWASPPCESYSFANPGNRHKYDRTLWSEALRVIDEAKPKYWVIENVLGACEAWGRPKEHFCAWYFWGWYPKVKWPKKRLKKHGWDLPGWTTQKTKLARAAIPYEISEAFYNALTD